MVGLGLLMTVQGLAGLVLRIRGRLYRGRWLQRASLIMAPAGFLAMLAGWVVTEVGRQPFTVYGLLRTEESRSPVDLGFVLGSTAVILLVYLAVFGIGLRYLLRAMAQAPRHQERGPEPELANDTGAER